MLNSHLPMWEPLTPGSFTQFCPGPTHQHLLVGYPWTSTKGSTRESQRIELKGYLTSAAPPEEYQRLGADPVSDLVVLFKKEKVFDKGRKLVTFPDPYGMSGGAVFQFQDHAPTAQSLVGILIRWDLNRKIAMVARRIEAFTNNFRVTRIDFPKSPF